MALHERVLIANRGEIAIRIAKAAAALGLDTVAIYPAADALSLHTRLTTQARALGQDLPQDAVAAYLDGAAIIEIAKDTGCGCIHPGYGFLAENANFAALCADQGITFIGPPPSALRLFGDKLILSF